MHEERNLPDFNDHFRELNHFILELVNLYRAGQINSWDDLEPLVNAFFTRQRMEQMETLVPHWQKMTSYLEGITLVHVMCVFMGLYMLPEYQSMTPHQQDLMKWIILLHDVEKEVEKGKRDPIHALRSAVTAAQRLPHFGFDTTDEYPGQIDSWSDFTRSAMIEADSVRERIPDKSKYPEILSGIDRVFGMNSSGALIVKTVLLHLSINVVKDWPSAAPLTAEEIKQYIDKDLVPLLKVMMLADNEGWALFYPEDRAKQRIETLETYAEIEKSIL